MHPEGHILTNSDNPIFYLIALALNFRRDELIALAVDVDNLNRRVIFQVLTQLGNVYIH